MNTKINGLDINVKFTEFGIPKLIHQTYKDENIPDHWKISPREWKEKHPDYDYIFWTDSDIFKYMEEMHPDKLEIFKSFKHNIQRVDMFRYFILYDYGGIYSDLDNYPFENIEIYLNKNTDAYFTGSPVIKTCLTNNFMVARPKTNIFKYICDKVKNEKPWYCYSKFLEVMCTTGPNFLDKTVKKFGKDYYVLPTNKFNAYSVLDSYEKRKDGSVIGQLKGQSWTETNVEAYTFLVVNWILIFILIVLVIYFILYFVYIFRNKEIDFS